MDIEVETADEIATVTLARPARRNAMSLAMWRALPQIFGDLGQNPKVRAIILTGAGGNFCAGADIAEFAQVRATVEQSTEYDVALDACCTAIERVSKPTIAVIRGYCMGGGCHLAMACDFRYVNAGAIFAIPAARLSIVYGVNGTRKLLALVGVANAKHILFSAARFDAAEALRMGFADRVDEDAGTAARTFASTLAQNAPLSIAGAKVLLNELSSGAGLLSKAVASDVIARAVGSADYIEGRTAFIEKRTPRFRGR